jgi:serine/threonine-protein kinase
MAVSPKSIPLEQGDCLGGYRIVETLGAGGMGVVYRAVQVQLNRQVALKVLAPSAKLGQEARQRFLQEARLAARVSDPCIIRVLDAGDERQLLFIVYELIHGPSLRERLRERQRFQPGEAVTIVRACTRALAAIHAQGILHRDLKPDNILMCPTRGPLLGDFGCARDLTGESVQTTQGAVVGTVPYLSPERVCGNPAVPASDIYSLGIMLYELLTGRLPFIHRDLATILYMHMAAPIPRVREAVPEVPEALDDLVTRALAKSPETRIASAAELLRELARFPPAPEAGLEPARLTPRAASPAKARQSPARETAPHGMPQARRITALAAACGVGVLGTWWLLQAVQPPKPAGAPARVAAVERPARTASSTALAQQPALVVRSFGLLRVLLSTSHELSEKHARQDPRVDSARFQGVILPIWTRLLQSLQETFSAPAAPDRGDPELLLARSFLAGRKTGADLTDIASRERVSQDPTESLNLAALVRYQSGLDDFRKRGGEEALRFLQRLPERVHASREPFLLAGLASLETLARFTPDATKQLASRRHPIAAVARELMPALTRPDATDPRNLLAAEALLCALGEAGERSTQVSLCEDALAPLRAAASAPPTPAFIQAFVMRLMLEARRLELKADFRGYTATASARARALDEWRQLAGVARATVNGPAWQDFGRTGGLPPAGAAPDLFQEGLRWTQYCEGQVAFLLRELGGAGSAR